MVLDIIKNVAVVGAGSFIGGAARYLVSLLMKGIGKGFPWATLSVNLVGCFQIVGNNTNYLLAAEECMAENFGLVFGNGLNGYYDFGNESIHFVPYSTPELIHRIYETMLELYPR